jgi:fucose permease
VDSAAVDGRPFGVVPVRSRIALALVFLVNGAILASWVPHIPSVKQQHGIGDGQLGAILLCMAAGAVCALSVAGRLVARFGSRTTTAFGATALCLALPLPILSPTVPLLALSLVVLGASNGLLDVSINAQAVLVEQRYGRPIMSSFHGLFGVGGLVGAAAAGAVMWLGGSGGQHVVGTALAALLLVAAVRSWLIADPVRDGSAAPAFARPTGLLVWLGLLAFAALMAEGAMGDWSAVYLHEVLQATPALAAAGFAAFSSTMAIGRLAGDRIVTRFGAQTVLRASGGLAALGLTAALLLGDPIAAIAGCALVGLGIANVIPVLFSRAGSLPGVESGSALAAVTAIGYCGFLAGPPVIGVVAEFTSLPYGLGMVVVGCGLIALFAGVVRQR